MGTNPEHLPLADMRRSYARGALLEDDVDPDPVVQFARWLADAVAAHQPGFDEPHAMTLATADLSGAPSARTVLLKGLDHRGFVWFTNYESMKGRELAANPRAALNFRWGSLERQVTVVGDVERVAASESDAYFQSRPLASRIGAMVSAQSTVIASRAQLEAAADALASGPEGGIVRPQNWGGYRLAPRTVELWQGRPNRLHDRLRYARRGPGEAWVMERLAP
jgi:pyridoxamine 5'-phosphate oxidase